MTDKAYEAFLNKNPADYPQVQMAIDDMKKSGLSYSTLTRAGVRMLNINSADLELKQRHGKVKKVDENGEKDFITIRHVLIEFPYRDEAGGYIYSRYKIVPPVEGQDGKNLKYWQPANSLAVPYIIPGVWEVKDKTNKPIWITEGEKKALSLCQNEENAIGISGVYNFRAGKDHFVEDDRYLWEAIRKFKFSGRTVYLSFDIDLWDNKMVRRALYELAFKLYGLGANVYIVTWNGEKGIDDLLASKADPGKTLEELKSSAKEQGELLRFCRPEHSDEVISAVALAKIERSDFMKVLNTLSEKKKIGYTKSELKQAIEEERLSNQAKRDLKSNDVSEEDQYYIDEQDNFYHIVRTQNGVFTEKLANFTAQIDTEIIEDNGVDRKVSYVITGKSQKNDLPRIEIPAEAFNAMAWTQKWGSRQILEPGLATKERLRHGIQTTSSALQKICYTHTGWREIGKEPVYLSSSGAIGRENVLVRLPSDIERYSMPSIVENELEAIKTSLSFLELTKHEITFPLFAYLYLAPLTTLLKLQPNFSVYLYGPSGSHKSTLAVAMLDHLGNFNAVQSLSNFGDTHNQLIERAFTLKDNLMVVDDYHPSATKQETDKKKSVFQELVRKFSNRTGRGRLKSDVSERERHPPRGLLIITGEDMVALQSTLARLMIIETKKGEVSLPKLTAYQQNSSLLPHAMASYLLWVRDHMDSIKESFEPTFVALREKAQDTKQHLKLAEQPAFLQFGMSLMLLWAKEKGALDEQTTNNMSKESWNIFMALAEQQAKRIEKDDPVEIFFEILETLITQGKVRIDDKTADKMVVGDMRQDFIGYYELGSEWLYLIPGAMWNVLQKYCISEGTHFPMTRETLLKMLKDRGLLHTHGDQHTAVTKVQVDGQITNKRLLNLRLNENLREAITSQYSIIDKIVASPELLHNLRN